MKSTSINHLLIRCVLGLAFLLAATPAASKVKIKLPKADGTVGEDISLPVTVSKLPGKSVKGYSLTIVYDAKVLTITSSGTASTVSEGATVEEDASESGKFTVDVTGDGPITGSGTLLNLNASLLAAGKTTLSVNHFSFKKGGPKVDAKKGKVKVKAADNSAPTFTSKPVTEAVQGEKYSYTATADDSDGDQLTFTADTIPDWLSLTDHGNGSATLSGTPPASSDDDNADEDDGDHDDEHDGDDEDDDDEDDDDDWDDDDWGKTVDQEVELSVSDGEDEDEQKFDIEISPNEENPNESTNEPPNAVSDHASTQEGTAVSIDVLTNDSDPDGEGLQISQVGSPEHGAASSSNGEITYVPDDGFAGEDNFTYAIEDKQGASDNADVTVSVEANDSGSDEPGGGSDEDSSGDGSDENSSGEESDNNNAGDGSDDNNTGNETNDDDPSGEPDDGSSGGGSGGNDSGPSENQSPSANDDAGTTPEDTAIRLNVLDNDTDPDGESLSVSAVSSAEAGNVSLNRNGSISYTPDSDYVGDDEFTYEITDSHGNTDKARVELTIQPVNDRPRFSAGGNVEVNATDGPQRIEDWAESIHPGAPNEDDQTLTFDVSVDNPALFTQNPSIDADEGDLTFTPADDNSGTAEVTVVLQDDGGTAHGGNDTSERASFTIKVIAPNSAPTFTSAATTAATAGERYAYTASASDRDGDALTITAAEVPGWLSFSDNGDGTGSLEGTPSRDKVGEHEVILRASDGEKIAEQSFSITVSAGNSAPTISSIDDQLTTINTPIELTDISVSDETTANSKLTVTISSSNQSLLPNRNVTVTKNDSSYDLSLVPASNQTGVATVTLTVSDGELETQVNFRLRVVPDNEQPEHPPAVGISDGASVVIEGDPSQTFLIKWGGNLTNSRGRATYTWKLAESRAFSNLLLRRSTGRVPYVELTYGTIDSLLAAIGVRINETVDLYHRIDRTRNGETTEGDVYRIRFTRGHVGRGSLPETFMLEQNYPNPFNPSTTIEYGLPTQAHVRLVIYDAVGKRITVLVDETQDPGWHQTVWDAGGNRSGPYFYQLQTDDVVRTKKLLFLK